MATPFAQVGDLESFWRPLSDDEEPRATSLLSYASVIIRQRFPRIDDRIAADTLDPEVPELVVISMVKRAMASPMDLDGVSQMSQQGGPFQQSMSYANPMGNLYLSRDDIRLLTGGSTQKAFTIDTTPPVVES